MHDQLKTKILQELRAFLETQDVYDKLYESPLTSATLGAHVTHDGQERPENEFMGRVLADHGHSGNLLPVGSIKGKRYPDYRRNDGVIMEFKKMDGRQSIKNGINSALAKGDDVSHVVFNVIKYDRGRASNQIYNQFKYRHQLQEVWLYRDGDLYYIKRKSLRIDLGKLPDWK